MLNYKLPAFPREGEWTVRVEALTQVHEYNIIVERFYYYFFDVYLVKYKVNDLMKRGLFTGDPISTCLRSRH